MATTRPARLRRAAEARVRGAPAPADAISVDELLHELRVHQIELEMQNDELRRTQQSLEELLERYRDLYDVAPVAYLTLTGAGVISEANLTASTLLGSGRRSLLGKRLAQFVAVEDRDLWYRSWREAMKRPGRLTVELAFDPGVPMRNGRLECLAVAGAEGKTNLRIALTDDTERKRAEAAVRESQEQLLLQAQILSRVTDGVTVVSAQTGRIVHVNPALEAMCGYGPGELAGLPVAVLNAPDDATPEAIAETIQAVLRGTGRWQGDLRNRRKDGSTFWTSMTITTHDLPPWGPVWLSTQRDVTERKQAEAERLAELGRGRDLLVREIHHRIKNHLQGVIGLLRVQASSHPGLEEPFQELIAQVGSIAGVYGLSTPGSGPPVALDAVLALVAGGVAGPVGVDHRSLTTAQVTLAEADAVPIALAVNELVGNAMKHLERSVPERPVAVRLDLAGGAARVVVSAGPARLPLGFDLEKRTRIGTGLELVSRLLPSRGARLTIRQVGDEVRAELSLEPPVVCIG